LHLRAEITDGPVATAANKPKRFRKFGESLAFRFYGYLWSGKNTYGFGMKAARIFQKLIVRNGKIGKAGGVVSAFLPPLASWTAKRDAPLVAPRSFREQWRDGLDQG
jgi:hypothetical protein